MSDGTNNSAPSAPNWIAAMASRLAYLKDADEATIWEAIPALFPDVVGVPCDKSNAYHCALAGAVVAAMRHPA